MTPEHNIPTLDTLTNTTVMDRVSPHSTPQCNDGSTDEQEQHLTLLLCYVNTSPQTRSECGFANLRQARVLNGAVCGNKLLHMRLENINPFLYWSLLMMNKKHLIMLVYFPSEMYV